MRWIIAGTRWHPPVDLDTGKSPYLRAGATLVIIIPVSANELILTRATLDRLITSLISRMVNVG